ncbi:MAG: hypothetical protein IJ234_08110 [Clostridia bacterium]|nr:hypothetical protein [Clostridia bacterium]
MAIMDGCEAKHKTPVLEERVCPMCGETVELFTRRGRVLEDTACDCGYIFKAEEQLSAPQAKKKEE